MPFDPTSIPTVPWILTENDYGGFQAQFFEIKRSELNLHGLIINDTIRNPPINYIHNPWSPRYSEKMFLHSDEFSYFDLKDFPYWLWCERIKDSKSWLNVKIWNDIG